MQLSLLSDMGAWVAFSTACCTRRQACLVIGSRTRGGKKQINPLHG
jgi:hypothetical protein